MDCEKYRKRSKQIKIRLSEEEYEKIMEHSKVAGKNVNSLLREAYFRRAMNLHVVHKDELKKINSDLSRIGGNVHQLVKALNIGGAVNLRDLGSAMAEIAVMREILRDKICQ